MKVPSFENAVKMTPGKLNSKVLRLTTTFCEIIVYSLCHSNLTLTFNVAPSCKLKYKCILSLKILPINVCEICCCVFILQCQYKYIHMRSGHTIGDSAGKHWGSEISAIYILVPWRSNENEGLFNYQLHFFMGPSFSKPWVSTASQTDVWNIPSEVSVLCQFPNCFLSGVFKENITNCWSNCVHLLELSWTWCWYVLKVAGKLQWEGWHGNFKVMDINLHWETLACLTCSSTQ